MLKLISLIAGLLEKVASYFSLKQTIDIGKAVEQRDTFEDQLDKINEKRRRDKLLRANPKLRRWLFDYAKRDK